MSPIRRRWTKDVQDFVAHHQGVEAYLEPQTVNFKQSVLLVARSGLWSRVDVPDRRQIETACRKLGVPLYDAAIVGYPERMKTRDARLETPSAEELEKWMTESEPPPDRNE